MGFTRNIAGFSQKIRPIRDGGRIATDNELVMGARASRSVSPAVFGVPPKTLRRRTRAQFGEVPDASTRRRDADGSDRDGHAPLSQPNRSSPAMIVSSETLSPNSELSWLGRRHFSASGLLLFGGRDVRAPLLPTRQFPDVNILEEEFVAVVLQFDLAGGINRFVAFPIILQGRIVDHQFVVQIDMHLFAHH